MKMTIVTTVTLRFNDTIIALLAWGGCFYDVTNADLSSEIYCTAGVKSNKFFCCPVYTSECELKECAC